MQNYNIFDICKSKINNILADAETRLTQTCVIQCCVIQVCVRLILIKIIVTFCKYLHQ